MIALTVGMLGRDCIDRSVETYWAPSSLAA